ncbi:MAG: FxLYD domain-containing protein [Salinibacter sp.]
MVFSDATPRSFVRASLAAGLLLFAAACGSSQSGTDLKVVEPRLVQTPSGERSFTGTLVNNGASPIPIAQVEVALYDDDGSPVERVQIEVSDIPAQDSVEFSKPINTDRSFRQAQVQRVLAP